MLRERGRKDIERHHEGCLWAKHRSAPSTSQLSPHCSTKHVALLPLWFTREGPKAQRGKLPDTVTKRGSGGIPAHIPLPASPACTGDREAWGASGPSVYLVNEVTAASWGAGGVPGALEALCGTAFQSRWDAVEGDGTGSNRVLQVLFLFCFVSGGLTL